MAGRASIFDRAAPSSAPAQATVRGSIAGPFAAGTSAAAAGASAAFAASAATSAALTSATRVYGRSSEVFVDDDSSDRHSGWLFKRSPGKSRLSGGAWKRRFFVLRRAMVTGPVVCEKSTWLGGTTTFEVTVPPSEVRTSRLLLYFERPDSARPLGAVRLHPGSRVIRASATNTEILPLPHSAAVNPGPTQGPPPSKSNTHALLIECDGRTILVASDNEWAVNEWLMTLNKTIAALKADGEAAVSCGSVGAFLTGAGAPVDGSMRPESAAPPPSPPFGAASAPAAAAAAAAAVASAAASASGAASPETSTSVRMTSVGSPSSVPLHLGSSASLVGSGPSGSALSSPTGGTGSPLGGAVSPVGARIVAGTVSGLIDELVNEKNTEFLDTKNIQAFLLMHKSFTSPHALLSGLVERFYNAHSSGALSIQLRVMHVLRSWVRSFPEDFTPMTRLQRVLSMEAAEASSPDALSSGSPDHEPEVDMLQALEAFLADVQNAPTDPAVKGLATHVDRTLQEQLSKSRMIKHPTTRISAGSFSSSALLTSSGACSLSATSCVIGTLMGAEDVRSTGSAITAALGLSSSSSSRRREQTKQLLAEQLTMVDFELYRKIRSSELIDKAWTRPDKDVRARHVRAILRHSNRVTRWVMACILREHPRTRTAEELARSPDLESVVDASTAFRNRRAMLFKFIKLAFVSLGMRNFNTTFSLVTALKATPVHRLRSCWDTLPSASQEMWDELERATDQSKGRKHYRALLLAATGQPAVPFLGSALSDLLLAEESASLNQSALERVVRRGGVATAADAAAAAEEEAAETEAARVAASRRLAAAASTSASTSVAVSMAASASAPAAATATSSVAAPVDISSPLPTHVPSHNRETSGDSSDSGATSRPTVSSSASYSSVRIRKAMPSLPPPPGATVAPVPAPAPLPAPAPELATELKPGSAADADAPAQSAEYVVPSAIVGDAHADGDVDVDVDVVADAVAAIDQEVIDDVVLDGEGGEGTVTAGSPSKADAGGDVSILRRSEFKRISDLFNDDGSAAVADEKSDNLSDAQPADDDSSSGPVRASLSSSHSGSASGPTASRRRQQQSLQGLRMIGTLSSAAAPVHELDHSSGSASATPVGRSSASFWRGSTSAALVGASAGGAAQRRGMAPIADAAAGDGADEDDGAASDRDEEEEKVVNFSKQRLIAEIMHEYLRFQNSRFEIMPAHAVQRGLLQEIEQASQLNEDEFWRLSYLCEPKRTEG